MIYLDPTTNNNQHLVVCCWNIN